MPINYKRDYPPNWKEVSRFIRNERAGGRCECQGECGLHRGRRCEERNGEAAKWANGKVILTVAHLWKGPCKPCAEKGKKCAYKSHLKAMCNRCHLRYDIEHHMRNARTSREKKQGLQRMF